jgi:hypothetical protein
MFQTVMVHKLRKNGFSAVDSSDEHPDTINTKENKLPVKITTHIFLEHRTYSGVSIHVVVFHKRKAGFLWHSQIQIATTELAFGSKAGAYEM